jgi:hypothetical protein
MHDHAGIHWLTPNAIYTLTNSVTAFRTSRDHQGVERGGPICELPEDAELVLLGGGFNHRTVKVKYGYCEYFLYWRDLASAKIRGAVTSDVQVGLIQLGKMIAGHGEHIAVESAERLSTNCE